MTESKCTSLLKIKWEAGNTSLTYRLGGNTYAPGLQNDGQDINTMVLISP